MNNEKHNGWTNYATWRVALEIFDGMDVRDISTSRNVFEVGEALKEYVNEILFSGSEYGLLESYADAFLSHVVWWQIADNLISELDEAEAQ